MKNVSLSLHTHYKIYMQKNIKEIPGTQSVYSFTQPPPRTAQPTPHIPTTTATKNALYATQT